MTLRTVGIIGAGLVLAVVVVAAGAAAGIASLFGGPLFAGDITASAQAQAEIPASYLEAFHAAAATCPGLPWSVLAGIGRVETDFGTDTQTSSAGAVGPMQFLPATFAAYDIPVRPGGATPPSPYDPTDAVYAAARDLCTNGARGGADIPGAVFAYNHSRGYVAEVFSYAASYAAPAPAITATGPSPAAAEAVSYALDQIGTPYRWGGETPGVGFDCSGLTQAPYAAAGIVIPRTSEAQWSALPHVPLDQLEPGDLVFFDPGEFLAVLPGHVGIYIGSGEMVDAPHTGATVRIENLASWPTPMGATRPALASSP
ncbi:MAG TPA: bifunctional lytic transglycosylase/C40 family peptidase [Acidimicrobiales bacterium]|nr:bifunctional lytic transglycosylase/C40 family peptidase [Acidimicrobiales bacterium]